MAVEQTFCESAPKPNSWLAVWTLCLCAMLLVASDLMPVVFLTPIASDLHISDGQTGRYIYLSGICAVISSLCLPMIVGSLNRRVVLLGLIFFVGLSGFVIATAPNASMFIVGRALLGLCVGGFWSMSAATAIRLVSVAQVATAMVIINAGGALANAIGVPSASYLGTLVGWRTIYFSIIPVAAIAFVFLWYSVPSLPVPPKKRSLLVLVTPFQFLARKDVAITIASIVLHLLGYFSLFTFLRPFLEKHTGVAAEEYSLILMVIGSAGVIGTTLMRKFVSKAYMTVLTVIPLILMSVSLGLVAFGTSVSAVFSMLAIWGFFATSMPVAWWTWVANAMPDNAEAGGGLFVAATQIAITLGATVGGIVFDFTGFEVTFIMSAVFFFLSSLVAIMAKRISFCNKPLNYHV